MEADNRAGGGEKEDRFQEKSGENCGIHIKRAVPQRFLST